jgi:hypothetical protein
MRQSRSQDRPLTFPGFPGKVVNCVAVAYLIVMTDSRGGLADVVSG